MFEEVKPDQTYLADVVRIGFRKQNLRDVRGHVSLNFVSLPSSNVVFLSRKT